MSSCPPPRGVSPTRMFQFLLFALISSRIEAADPRIDITANGATAPFCYDTPSEVFPEFVHLSTPSKRAITVWILTHSQEENN